MTQFGFISVSIIIPVYNVEPYIARCLQSVMDQTYEGTMECILVDDCCTDNSLAIVGQMLDSYNGTISFKVLHHERNRGQAAARNTGTKVATGDYIYYLDSDDAMMPDCIALMIEEVEKHPEVEMVVGGHHIIRETGELQRVLFGSARYVDDNDVIRLLYFENKALVSSVVWNRLINKSFVLSNGLEFLENVIFEDDHWSFYVFKKLERLSILETCTYSHYILQGSTMTSVTKQRIAESVFAILKDLVGNIDGKFSELQLFWCAEEYLYYVFPYFEKKRTKTLHYFFTKKLICYGYLRIAFYFMVNRIVKWRYYRLSYEMIPEAHQLESEKSKTSSRGFSKRR